MFPQQGLGLTISWLCVFARVRACACVFVRVCVHEINTSMMSCSAQLLSSMATGNAAADAPASLHQITLVRVCPLCRVLASISIMYVHTSDTSRTRRFHVGNSVRRLLARSMSATRKRQRTKTEIGPARSRTKSKVSRDVLRTCRDCFSLVLLRFP